MTDQETYLMTPLDQMLSSESLQILKAAVPYAPPDMQKFLSVYAKARELRAALLLFPSGENLQAMSAEPARFSPTEMLDDICRFVPDPARENLERLSSALAAARMFRCMQTEEPSDTENADPGKGSGEKGE